MMKYITIDNPNVYRGVVYRGVVYQEGTRYSTKLHTYQRIYVLLRNIICCI
jgi:hypothetical protein